MGNDIYCPECGIEIGFRNVISFEKEVFTIEGVYYILTCKKCDTTFIPSLRMTVDLGKMSKKAQQAMEELNNLCKKKEFKKKD